MGRRLNAGPEQQATHNYNARFIESILDKLVIECEQREHNGVSGELTLRIVWKDGRAESARLTPEEILRPAP